MKKIPHFSELAYLCGQALLPLGAAMMVKGNLGVSMVVAPAYLLSERFAALSFGQAEYLLQAVLLAAMCALLRRVRLRYLLSFVTAVLYGFILDGWTALLAPIDASSMPARLAFFALGLAVSSLGVAFFFRSCFAPCAYDLFVQDVSEGLRLDRTRFKTGYDCASLAVAVAMSLLFFGTICGVSWGTLLCALVNGRLIGVLGNVLDRYIDFSPRFALSERLR